jgi:hypothetical protein
MPMMGSQANEKKHPGDHTVPDSPPSDANGGYADWQKYVNGGDTNHDYQNYQPGGQTSTKDAGSGGYGNWQQYMGQNTHSGGSGSEKMPLMGSSGPAAGGSPPSPAGGGAASNGGYGNWQQYTQGGGAGGQGGGAPAPGAQGGDFIQKYTKNGGGAGANYPGNQNWQKKFDSGSPEDSTNQNNWDHWMNGQQHSTEFEKKHAEDNTAPASPSGANGVSEETEKQVEADEPQYSKDNPPPTDSLVGAPPGDLEGAPPGDLEGKITKDRASSEEHSHKIPLLGNSGPAATPDALAMAASYQEWDRPGTKIPSSHSQPVHKAPESGPAPTGKNGHPVADEPAELADPNNPPPADMMGTVSSK